MIYKVIAAKHVRDFIIHLKFNDGLEGDVNLKDELEGDVFSALKNLNEFKKFKVHSELHTLSLGKRC
jgi:hypothetical protein